MNMGMTAPVGHLFGQAVCPFLPMPEVPLTAACLAGCAGDRGPEFYLAALGYGHSLWLQGFPARALLLLNRAMGADLRHGEPVLQSWPLPYAAVAWMLSHHRDDQFLGNPRRHWQHLATRMVEPRRELRTWRAWACWHLARVILPELPADEAQITAEGVVEPDAATVAARLAALGQPGEAGAWQAVVDHSGCRRSHLGNA
jgi:hypothetical protein